MSQPLWVPVLRRTTERPIRTFSNNWEIFDEWSAALKAKSRNVQKHYPVYLRVFMEMWEGTPVTTLASADLQLFMDRVATKCAKLMRSNPPQCLAGQDLRGCPLLQGKEGSLCPKYKPLDLNAQKSYLTSINSLYEWLLREGHVKYNPLGPVQAKFFEENRAYLQKRRRIRFAREQERQPKAYPPCIRLYLSKLEQGMHVNHDERFNLVAFLHMFGASSGEIVDLFRGVPGYDESTTQYQVNHITGKPNRGGPAGYAPMGCKKMRDLRICPDAKCPGPTPALLYARALSASKPGGA